MAAWSILSGAALPTHDAVILGAKGLFGQRLVTLHTAETLLMPVAALVAELLVQDRTVESLMRGTWRENKATLMSNTYTEQNYKCNTIVFHYEQKI